MPLLLAILHFCSVNIALLVARLKLHIHKYHGPDRELDPTVLAANDVVLCSYAGGRFAICVPPYVPDSFPALVRRGY